jgi:uncharacterized ubiquitin-like protein YukD
MRNNFTPEEIKEVEELIKVMNKEQLSSHFKIRPYVLDKFREIQPELEEAFQRGLAVRKGKKHVVAMRNNFTPEEIKEVEELIKVMNKEQLSSHFKIKKYVFDRFRQIQPELEEAFQRGLAGRKGKNNFERKKRKIFDEPMPTPIPKLKYTLTLSENDAWAKFKKEFDEKKKKRSIKELSYDRYEF